MENAIWLHVKAFNSDVAPNTNTLHVRLLKSYVLSFYYSGFGVSTDDPLSHNTYC